MKGRQGVESTGGHGPSDVGHLPADHALVARSIRKAPDHVDNVMGREVCFGQQTKSIGEEGITREDGRGLIVCAMNGGTTTPHVVIVHGGKVIVNKAVGMDELHGPCGMVRGRQRSLWAEKCTRRSEREQWAHALSAPEDGVAEGLIEGGWPCVAVPIMKKGIELSAVLGGPCREVEAHRRHLRRDVPFNQERTASGSE